MAQVCVRGIIVFIAALIIVRCGHKRFLAKLTAFDAVLGFMLSSALARAINGSAPFFPTLVMAFVLVMLHRVFSALAFHSAWFGTLVKGSETKLVESGHPLRDVLKQHKISEKDVLEQARLNGSVMQFEKIQTAILERSGDVSIIPMKD